MRRKPQSPQTLARLLTNPYWIPRFIARQTLIAMGGPAVRALTPARGLPERSAWDVLEAVSKHTSLQHAERYRTLLCPDCLARFHEHKVALPDRSLPLYGCRNCFNSETVLGCPGEVVAVLDHKLIGYWRPAGDTLRVNALRRHPPFHFDRVEIVDATDKEVARLVVQAGNDPDARRRARRRQLAENEP